MYFILNYKKENGLDCNRLAGFFSQLTDYSIIFSSKKKPSNDNDSGEGGQSHITIIVVVQ